jgi:hypothetical protein
MTTQEQKTRILIRDGAVWLPLRVEKLEQLLMECDQYPDSIVWKIRDFVERAQAQQAEAEVGD